MKIYELKGLHESQISFYHRLLFFFMYVMCYVLKITEI